MKNINFFKNVDEQFFFLIVQD